ncbi:hypothetical protein BH11BAC2_BH11BAC2_13080 [soil metagenome]
MIFKNQLSKYTQQLLLLCVLSLIYTTAEAQLNLVPNASFEVYDSCPYFISSTNYNLGINLASPWFQPNNNGNSTDYFNACDSTLNQMGIPFNYEGYQIAHTGVGYAGFSTGAITLFLPIREYLEVELADTLIAGNKYCVEYYVSHANFSDRSTDNISTYFSNNAVYGTDYLVLNYVPQINSPVGVVIDDTLIWVQVYGEYIANGGERFMTIGNFSTDSNTTLVFNNYGTHPYAYYYIDDVSVIDCTNTGIPDSNLGKDLELYPNPVKDILNIKFGNSGESNHECLLTDLAGKTIFRRTYNQESEIQINLSTCSPGIYFLTIFDGKSFVTRKVVHLF